MVYIKASLLLDIARHFRKPRYCSNRLDAEKDRTFIVIKL